MNLSQLGPTTHTAPKNPFASGNSQNYKWETQPTIQPTLQQMQGQVGMNQSVGQNVTGGSFPVAFNSTGGSFSQPGFVNQNITGGFPQQGFQNGQQRPAQKGSNPFSQTNFFN